MTSKEEEFWGNFFAGWTVLMVPFIGYLLLRSQPIRSMLIGLVVVFVGTHLISWIGKMALKLYAKLSS
jgi:hypothetical protein